MSGDWPYGRLLVVWHGNEEETKFQELEKRRNELMKKTVETGKFFVKIWKKNNGEVKCELLF